MGLVEAVVAIFTVAFAGGIAAIWKARAQSREAQVNAEAVKQRLGPEVAGIATEALSAVIERVREENQQAYARMDRMDQRHDSEITEVRGEVRDIRNRLDRAERALKVSVRHIEELWRWILSGSKGDLPNIPIELHDYLSPDTFRTVQKQQGKYSPGHKPPAVD